MTIASVCPPASIPAALPSPPADQPLPGTRPERSPQQQPAASQGKREEFGRHEKVEAQQLMGYEEDYSQEYWRQEGKPGQRSARDCQRFGKNSFIIHSFDPFGVSASGGLLEWVVELKKQQVCHPAISHKPAPHYLQYRILKREIQYVGRSVG